MSTDRGWMYKKNDCHEFRRVDYIVAMDNFLDYAYANVGTVEKKPTRNGIMLRIRCPCRKCENLGFKERDEVRLHLMKHGFMPDYTIWWGHGETFYYAPDQDVGQSSNTLVVDHNEGYVEIVNDHNKSNRNTEYGGMTSRHCCGSITIAQHRDRMREAWGRDPTAREVYERMHCTNNRKLVTGATGLSTDPPIYPYPKAAEFAGNYGQIRAEEYPDLPPDVVPPNDTELWKPSVGGRRKGHIFGFGTYDLEYAMSGDSGAATSGSSHREEEWDALKEEVRKEREARLKMEEEARQDREARKALEEKVKLFEAFVRQFGSSPAPPPPPPV